MTEQHKKYALGGALLILALFIIPRLFLGTGGRDASDVVLSHESGKMDKKEQLSRDSLIRAYFQEAEVAGQAGSYDVALDSVEKLLKLNPENKKAKKLQEEILASQEKHDISKSATLQEEVWLRDLMQKVELALKGQNLQRAELLLHQLLEEKPTHRSANALLKKMKEEKEGKMRARKERQEGERKGLKRAASLYRQAQAEEKTGDMAQAYQFHVELKKLLEEAKLKPAFLLESQRARERVYNRLLSEMEPRFQKANRQLSQAERMNGAEIKTQAYHEVVRELLALNQPGYPNHPKAKQAIQVAYGRLNELAEVYYIKARTLEELETCSLAVSGYRRAMEVAKFREIPVYQMAKEALDNCQ